MIKAVLFLRMLTWIQSNRKKGIGLIPLAALVIGSAIGGGVFGIMTDISGSAGGPAIFQLGTRRNSNVDALLVDQ